MHPSNPNDEPKIPEYPEQDHAGEGDLPTYDDLTAQHAQEPNSRFGRWRSWIGKRAAERYAEMTYEDHERRRARGWDIDSNPSIVIEQSDGYDPDDPFGPHTPRQLRLVTDLDEMPPPLPPKGRASHGDTMASMDLPDYSDDPSRPILSAQSLAPSHLLLNHFGSRFIPHAKEPIRCLLPLPSERLLLIGTDDGLSALNLFPTEWTENGLIQKGPNDASARTIWTGESVLQMSLLECEPGGEHGVNGVVLILTGGDCMSPRESESVRAIRMYNLASLISLAKWAISDRMIHPLDLRRPAGWQQQDTPKKKHGRHTSIAKGLNSLILGSPSADRTIQPFQTHGVSSDQQGSRTTPPFPAAEKPTSPSSGRLRPQRDDSNDSVASWDVVEDLPLRWATDFIPLATPGSRLTNMSVLAYDLRLSDESQSRGGAFLAVATKTAILLYETPKGERAFKFVKEFYTPLAPRSVTFVQQSVHSQTISGSSDTNRLARPGNPRRPSDTSLNSALYPPQLCIFTIFEKKAGIIRIADSAVGELELFSGNDKDASVLPASYSSKDSVNRLGPNLSASISGNIGSHRRSHSAGSSRRERAGWLHPVRIDVPPPPSSANYTLPVPGAPGNIPIYLLTRGKTTHVLPCPLPANIGAKPPLRVITWGTPPTHVSIRVNQAGATPFLQAIAFSEDGLEIRELSRELILGNDHAKGKSRAMEPILADADVGGEVGFLCAGGHWQRAQTPSLARAFSVASAASETSFQSLDSNQADARLMMEQGIYGWVCKGMEDYRIFWVGGTGNEDPDDVND